MPGIDVGVMYSSVSALQHNKVKIIPDAQGRKRIPTASLLQDHEVDRANAPNLALPPLDEQRLSVIMTRLKALAESFLGQPVQQAVITVPASSGDRHRQITRDAGSKAGLQVLRLLNSSAAAAMAHSYFHPRSHDQTIVLEVGQGLFETVSTAGDDSLGGSAYDAQICTIFGSNIQHGTHGTAFETCEQLKILLSTSRGRLSDHDILIARNLFNSMCETIFRSTVELVKRVLLDAKINKSDVNELVLVGGSVRIPGLQSAISAYFDRSQHSIRYPKLAGARGAALIAETLTGATPHPRFLTLDAVFHPIRLELSPGFLVQICVRNASYPLDVSNSVAVRNRRYLPQYLRVFEGDGSSTKAIGSFNLTTLRSWSSVSNELILKIDVGVNTDGIVVASLACRDSESGTEITVLLDKNFPLGNDDEDH
ncbi:actin-like ATPase domain-containing protein [Aspergillus sclerotiicarbonarius CBS 121057]|uniref:Actin-like ATPase domain-containing protein n=1 Tax=Aspergillus sclerotiicarbonarius (strain CBS 121057 / IBT 28362) TaxID=1448318 RepID=A0A319EHL6_ASPSB|nr:actin-like ATPase domain-containing protein [Aspergillus sclerotiicarbonarius CBS 121057]